MSSTRSLKKRGDQPRANRELNVYIRMTPEERAAVQAYADKYHRGNVSKWMRERSTKPMLDVTLMMQNEIDGFENN